MPRDLEDRFDALREDGATFAELHQGRRLADDRCANCTFWEPASLAKPGRRVCAVWLVEQHPGGWCMRHERWVERGSVLGRASR